MRYILLVIVVLAVSCSSNRYFIVRHAEKMVMAKDSLGMMANNPPLSEAGKARALALREELKNQHIKYIFSTNTIRTKTTAQPLSELLGNTRIEIYNPSKDSVDAFIAKLKSISKGNVLVVGHSNTVDDLANKLSGSAVVPGDLKDSDYDNLYEIKKKGGKYIFKAKKYGAPTE